MGLQRAHNAPSFSFMDKPFFVYALASQQDGRIYVGMSQDGDRRLNEHFTVEAKTTSIKVLNNPRVILPPYLQEKPYTRYILKVKLLTPTYLISFFAR